MLLINNKEFEFSRFPNGEVYVTTAQLQAYLQPDHGFNIALKYESNTDIINLELLTEAIKQVTRWMLWPLTIAYLPYSRNDHKEPNMTCFLPFIAAKINALKYPEVRILEPHSDVTALLIDNCIEVNVTQQLVEKYSGTVGSRKVIDAVMFPDAGAQKRYAKQFPGLRHVVGFKQRNAEGKITGYDLLGQVNEGDSVAIVDDLCSYGNTFIHAAKALRAKGAGHVNLFVAHCEDSIYKGDLLTSGLVDRVFTTNSLLTKVTEPSIITVTPFIEFT